MKKLIEIGTIFGRLIIIRHSTKTNIHKETYSVCKCKCGQVVEISNRSLKSGKTKSCGCIRKEGDRQRNLIQMGTKFNRLTVISTLINKYGKTMSLCKCSCGVEKVISNNDLKRGHTKSCGCLKKESTILAKTTHGLSHLIAYKSWNSMIDRSLNPNSLHYKNYGGRGITICDEWKNSFETFYKDMGDRPSKDYTLDRINNNGNYCKENCRWATQKEQGNNKRSNHTIEFEDKIMNIGEWETYLGFNKGTLTCRLNKLGWSVEKTLTTPLKIREKLVILKNNN